MIKTTSIPQLPQLSIILAIILIGIGIALLPIKLTVAAIVGSIVIIFSLLYPKLLLYLLIPAIPFGSLLQINLAGVNVGPVEALLGLMLFVWLLKMMMQQQIIIPHPPMLWPFLFFLGIIALSWINTFSIAGSLVETAKWLEMLALYLFITANFSAQESKYLVGVLLLTGLAQASLGIYQFVFKVGPPGFLLFGGRFLRAYGTFQQPNPYAGYLGLILPLALSITLWGVEQLKLKHLKSALLWTLLGAITFCGMALALFASQSRGGWLAFAVAATITILLKGGKWRVLTAFGLISIAILISMGALTLLPASITQRFNDVIPYIGVSDVSTIPLTNANFAAIERLAHWQAAQAMWLDHLWLGVGFGNYQTIYPAYTVGRWLDPLGHAHNYLLNIGAEMGLIGLLGYFIFWGWVITLTIKILHNTPPNSLQQAIIVGSLGIMCHLHSHNLVDNLYVQGMYLHLTIIFGLIALVKRN